MTWDYVRPSDRKEGTIQVRRAAQVEFAALIDRSDDPELRSLVKRDAWYSPVVPVRGFFAGLLPLRGTGGRHSCNRDPGIGPGEDMCAEWRGSVPAVLGRKRGFRRPEYAGGGGAFHARVPQLPARPLRGPFCNL